MRFARRHILLTLALPFLVGAAALGGHAPARPLILVVHGRGYLTRDSAMIRRQALHALREGSFGLAGDSLLADDDVRMVWYADVLDSRHRDSNQLKTCVRRDEGSATTISAASILRVFAVFASDLLEASVSGDQADDVRGVAGDLRFFGDQASRCLAEGRIADAISRAVDDGRPVVLVAHSLGALVAWSYLQHRGTASESQPPEIRRLVTIGSPLGSDDLRELLLDDSGPLALPRGVRSWVNVVNERDPFASRLLGRDSTGSQTRAIPEVSDVATQNGDDEPHELLSYLRDRSTVEAVLGAWCEAYAAVQKPRSTLSMPSPLSTNSASHIQNCGMRP